MLKSKSGFTIVELLIVIVVIAILAAVSTVAYSGIQQRATNTSIIASVGQAVKIITAYIAANGTYPLNSAGQRCIVPSVSTACTVSGTTVSINTTLDTNLKTMSELPSPLPDASPTYSGIAYNYNSSQTFDGISRPVMILYSLKGNQQQCGLPNVAANGSTTTTSTTTGWTGSSGGYTTCSVSIVGP